MLRAILYIFLLLVVLLLPGKLDAQQTQVVFRHFSTDEGLPSPEVYDVLEDAKGYIWFSTDNGVSRFNGYEFENFGYTQGLKNNVVFYLSEDKKGRIWMPTLSGNVYYYQEDSIYLYPYNDIVQKYLDNTNQLEQVYMDTLGTLHLVLMKHGILKIDANGKDKLISSELPCGIVFYLIEDILLYNQVDEFNQVIRDIGNCYVLECGKEEIPLTFVEDGNKETILLPHPIASRLHAHGFAAKLKDSLIAFSVRDQLYVFKEQRLIHQTNYPYGFNSGIQSKVGEIFFGNYRNGGVRFYNNNRDLLAGHFRTFLMGHTVSHVLVDRVGAYWFTTIDDGIYYVPNSQYELLNGDSGLSSDYIAAVTLKNEKELYVGLRNGDIFLWDRQEQTLNPLPKDEQMDIEILDLHYDTLNQRLWKGSNQLQFLENEKWVPTVLAKNRYPITGRGNKKFQICTEDNKLWGCNPGNLGFTNVSLDQGLVYDMPSSTTGRTLVVFKDVVGKIWVGKVDGLYEYREDSLFQQKGEMEAFTFRIEDIKQMKDSTLVLATKRGGVVFWKGDNYLQITEKDGLTADLVENIHIDAQQNIWAGTLNGLNKINLQEDWSYQIEKLQISDGLPSNEINDLASWGATLWVATTKGLVRISNAQERLSEGQPLHIESVKVNGELMDPQEVKVLPYYKNNLQISFLALNFRQNGKIPYRYRFSSTESWNYTQNRRVDYRVEVAGNYNFEVQAQNENGDWTTSSTWSFTIRRPFWESIYFWVMISLAIISLIFWYYQNRIRNIEKAAALDRQINHLKQAALRSQMNPHFIFNCLNAIQDAVNNGEKLKVAGYHSRFAKLIRLVVDTTTQEYISLSDDIQLLEHYLELEKMRMDNKFTFQMQIPEDINLESIQIPPLLIQPYVENAIIHGMQDAKGDGKIHISYILEKDYLFVQVDDNGIGMEESRSRKMRKNSKNKSVGMSIPEKRLFLLHPDPQKAQVKIQEKITANGQIEGTIVQLRIPVGTMN